MSNLLIPTRVTIRAPQRQEVRAVGIQPQQAQAGVTQLRNLTDVDSTSLDNNETVVYDSDTDKFVVKALPAINGGTY